MRYPFSCEQHGEFEIQALISEGPPPHVPCPTCNVDASRIYESIVEIWNVDGSSRDYHKSNPGRGQSWDKREQLNENWSKATGTSPPPADSVGTYDGIPRKGQVIRKHK